VYAQLLEPYKPQEVGMTLAPGWLYRNFFLSVNVTLRQDLVLFFLAKARRFLMVF
jgi:hypothetical protein